MKGDIQPEDFTSQDPAGLHLSPAGINPTLECALQLYDLDLNVFPQPYQQKSGFPWKELQYTRLLRSDLLRLFAGRCNPAVMVGRTSRNLFVIDCETEDALAEHLLATVKRKIVPWVVKTARGGHLYFFCANGEVKNIAPGALPDAEVRGTGGYVLCPPSLHPSGTCYTWHIREGDEPPTVTSDQIDWLQDAAGRPVRLNVKRLRQQSRPKSADSAVPKQLKRDKRAANLSKATLEYLASGRKIPEGTRNDALFKAACDLAVCGFDKAEALRLLAPIALGGGLKKKEVTRTIASAYSQPRTPSRPSTSPGYSPDLTAWLYAQAFVHRADWWGASAQTDRKVMLALIERAKLDMNEHGVFKASERSLMDIARTGSRNTVRKSLKRLQDETLIFKLEEKDHVSGATLWRFTDHLLEKGKRMLKSDPLNSLPLEGGPHGSLLHTTDQPGTDAAERGALGPSGMLVYKALLQVAGHKSTAKRVAQVTKLTPSQVYTGLRKLRRYGLVVNKRPWWEVIKVATDEELDTLVAKPAGTLGKGKQRVDKHAAERAAYAGQKIAQWRMRHDPFFPHGKAPIGVRQEIAEAGEDRFETDGQNRSEPVIIPIVESRFAGGDIEPLRTVLEWIASDMLQRPPTLEETIGQQVIIRWDGALKPVTLSLRTPQMEAP